MKAKTQSDLAAPAGPITVKVQYFAALRESAGIACEVVPFETKTAADLYEELSTRHRFKLGAAQVRVAINGKLGPMDQALSNGDHVVFIPPVAGG